jgi:poly(beta-D-mannuronate) lyase
MRRICLRILGCAYLAFCTSHLAASTPAGQLVSPWDTFASSGTSDDYKCRTPAAIAPDITITKNLNNSNLSPVVKDAAYAESSAALRDLAANTVAGADAFLRTGDPAAARCTVTLLANAAADHAMAGYMASSDAAAEQSVTLRSVAIAYLKVRASGAGTAEERALIQAWLGDVAQQERERITEGRCPQKMCFAHGHHGIAIVLADEAVAIANNDWKLFEWSMKQYRDAVGQIDGRGMLAADTHGQYALKFNLLSAACLAQIAELAAVNGVDLYGYDKGRIGILVESVSRGLIDPGPFAKAAGTAQTLPSRMQPWEIVWAAGYNRRFPDPVLTGLLEQVGQSGADMWGGEQL